MLPATQASETAKRLCNNVLVIKDYVNEITRSKCITRSIPYKKRVGLIKGLNTKFELKRFWLLEQKKWDDSFLFALSCRSFLT